MAEKTFTEEELIAEGATPAGGLTEEELLAEGAQPLELPTPERMAQELGAIGKDVVSGVGSGVQSIGDAIKYFDAPINEAAMIPKRVSESKSLADIGDALIKPIQQLGESGDDAPTARDIMTSYAVPDKNPDDPYRSVLWETFPKAAQLLKATTDISDQNLNQITPTPATMGAVAYDSVAGGKGLDLGLKTVKLAASAGANLLGHATDVITGSPFTSNLGKQAVDTVKNTGSEILDISRKFGNPKLVNTKEFFDGEKANLVEDVFGTDIPDVVRYTGDSEIVKMQRKLQTSADYGGEYAKKHNATITKVWDYVKNIPQQIVKGTKLGRPLDDREAGRFLIDQYNKIKNGIINQADLTRASIIDQLDEIPEPNFVQRLMGKSGYPPITPSSQQTIKDKVKLLTDKVVSMKIGQNNPLAEQLEELRLIMKDVGSIKDIRELQQKIKSVAELAFNIDSPFKPQDKKSLESLYHAMTNAFSDNVKHYFGDDIAKSLEVNNKALSDFFNKTDKIDGYLYERSQTKLTPEAAFRDLIEKGNSKELQQLADTLDPSDLDILRASYLNNKLFQKEALEFGEDIVSPKWQTIANNLNKDLSFKVLFKPSEQERILDSLALGQRIGAPIKKSQSMTVGGLKNRLLNIPAIKRHKNVMENAAPVFDESGRIGQARDAAIMGIKKQNVLDNYRPPMMTPEERLMMIDQDSSLLPTQRAVEKQKVFNGK